MRYMTYQLIKDSAEDIKRYAQTRTFRALSAQDRAELAAQVMEIALTLDDSLTADATEQDELCSTHEAAVMLGMKRAALLRKIREGQIRSVLAGEVGDRKLCIPKSAISEYLSR